MLEIQGEHGPDEGLAAAVEKYRGVDAPAGCSYETFLEFVQMPEIVRSPGPLSHLWNNLSTMAADLIKGAGGRVYLADQGFYTREGLDEEFPELRIFSIPFERAFSETLVPGIFAETQRFADLRCLSRLRRELKNSPLRPEYNDPEKSVEVVKLLLGLP